MASTSKTPRWSTLDREGLALAILRFGVAFVLIRFGVSKLMDTASWTYFVPQALRESLLASLELSPRALVHSAGVVELALGLQIFLGINLRISAICASAMLAVVTAVLGWGLPGTRNFGLLCACVSLAFVGAGSWSFDRWLTDRNQQTSAQIWVFGTRLAGLGLPALLAVFAISATDLSSGEARSRSAYLNQYGLAIPPLEAAVATNSSAVALGHSLFHDRRLSGDATISCATCHNLSCAGVDRRRLSVGIGGQLGTRNSPSVYNTSLHFRQFWDGRSKDLVSQASGPILNPTEMNGDWPTIVARLAGDRALLARFESAFATPEVTPERITEAIAAFERTLITVDSPYDRYVLGEEEALSETALRGLDTFSELGCVACHQGPAVGGTSFQRLGLLASYEHRRQHALFNDPGRYAITGNPDDLHRFKVPSLRNVALTGPYFHDGSVTHLDQAVQIMAEYQLGYALDEGTIADIVAFLESLTGRPPATSGVISFDECELRAP